MAAAPSRNESQAPATVPVIQTTEVGVLSLSDSVITEQRLAEKAKGQRVIEVVAKAIVTPSAKDWLRKNQVELRRVALSSKLPSALASRLAIVQAGGAVANRVIEDARKAGISNWRREPVGLAEEAAKVAISAITRGEAVSVVVFSDQSEKVACLANRNEQVRAAAVRTVSDVERVRESLDCNVYVVEVGSRGTFEMLRILKAVEAKHV